MRAFGRKAIFAAELIPMPVDDLLRWRAAGIHLRLIFEIAMIVRQIVDGNELRIERSEEHTSELQSLMRISYAVFCLKKNTIQNKKTIPHRRSKHNQTLMSDTISTSR